MTSLPHAASGGPAKDRIQRPGKLGRILLSLLITVVVVFVVVEVVISGAIKWDTVWKYLFAPPVLAGFLVTLELTVLSMVIGILLGVSAALMVRSRIRAVAWLGKGYIWLFRGTPVLVQLIFWFNLSLVVPRVGLGDWSISTNDLISPFMAALLGLGINEGAYMAEIFRAGIDSVDKGQTEGGLASGMTPGQVMRKIILPQAMVVIIPPTGNQAIGMLKTTSLVSVIAANDLLTQVQHIYAVNYQVIDLLIVACFWYLLATTIATWGQSKLERRFSGGNPAAVGTRRWRRTPSRQNTSAVPVQEGGLA